MKQDIHLNPVFIEPTFRHEFFSSNSRYYFIILFEIVIVMVLLVRFFETEIKAAFSRVVKRKNSRLDEIINKTLLSCDGDKLMILGLNGRVTALNRDGSDVIVRNCSQLITKQ